MNIARGQSYEEIIQEKCQDEDKFRENQLTNHIVSCKGFFICELSHHHGNYIPKGWQVSFVMKHFVLFILYNFTKVLKYLG